MSWNIQGSYFENCNCDTLCPCGWSGMAMPADGDRCRPVFAIHIESGNIDGVSVDDLTAIMVMETPKNLAEGGWQVGLIVDDKASEEQANGIVGVLSGQAGGPMAALAPLVGEMLGVERSPITYVNDGGTHSVKAGDAVDIEIDDLQLGEDGPAGLTGISVHPMGPDLTIAKATRATINAFGKQWDHSGKNGHAAPFSWSD